MRRRRLVLSSLTALGIAASCAASFEPSSEVNGLRILGVEADLPYAKPGDTVTLTMTVTDGLGDTAGKPRPLQLVWIGGCVNPVGDQYYLCFQQFAALLGQALPGGAGSDLVKFAVATPEQDGERGASSFSFVVPEDIVSQRPVPDAGPHYGIEYVFFAACAGTIAPADFTQTGAAPEFPLKCLDADGNAQGADSFVPGYTQIYSFSDGRSNENPPTIALTLDGVELPSEPDDAPIFARCAVTTEERRLSGCAAPIGLDACEEHKLSATVPDVAALLPDSGADVGGARRETIWVSYFSDGGTVGAGVALVSDSSKGYQAEHETTWLTPAEPGLVSLWAVTRDQQGGQSVRRGWARIE